MGKPKAHGFFVCFRCGPVALRFVTVGLRSNAPQRSAPALGAGVLQVRATGTVFRHGWPSAKLFLKEAPPALGGGCASGAGQWHCVSPRLAFDQIVPQSSAPALSGGCASGVGQWHCVSSRLACGQMFLKAEPPALGGGCALGAGQWHCVSSRLAFGQMFLKAAPRPIARGSVSKFSTKNTPNVENTRKE